MSRGGKVNGDPTSGDVCGKQTYDHGGIKVRLRTWDSGLCW